MAAGIPLSEVPGEVSEGLKTADVCSARRPTQTCRVKYLSSFLLNEMSQLFI